VKCLTIARRTDTGCQSALTNHGTADGPAAFSLATYLLSSPSVRVARRFVVSGRVQGVGFRYFAQTTAFRNGLHGWVRNTPDGCVEAVAEGEADAVERFEQALRHGPPHARVERVEIEHTVPAGMDTGFDVK
jgi:acylphosphatase